MFIKWANKREEISSSVRARLEAALEDAAPDARGRSDDQALTPEDEFDDGTGYVAGVNYPGGRATTILAGWRREFDSGGWVRESLSLVSFLRLLASEARQAGGVGRGAVVKPRTPSGAVHRLVLWAGGLSTAGAV
jgi:hypothetical protein